MEPLIILGTGVHAAEMAEMAGRINAGKPVWDLLGYIAKDGAETGRMINGYPVLGSMEALRQYPDARLVPDNEWANVADIPYDRFISLVDPQAVVSRTAAIGRGCVVYPNCYIGLNASLGDFVFCLSGCVINHDDVIGSRVVLASGVTLAGSVSVESGCYLGQSCSIRQTIRVGAGSLVGMGSIVIRDVPPNSVMAGNPARAIGRRNEREDNFENQSDG